MIDAFSNNIINVFACNLDFAYMSCWFISWVYFQQEINLF